MTAKAVIRILKGFLWLLFLCPSVVFSQVSFLRPGGFYQHAFALTLSSPGNQSIHYTLDGSVPTMQSLRYNAPLQLDESLHSTRNLFLDRCTPEELWNPPKSVEHAILVRAAAFDTQGNRIGDVVTHTYIIQDIVGSAPSLPVVSIAINPDDLFDADSGIFSPNGWRADDEYYSGNFNQHGREWERVANVEFHELNGGGFSQRLGVRVHGGRTRQYMQKPLKLYARNEYGRKKIEYPVFVDRPYSEYKRLVLRPFSVSWNMAGICDRVAQSIAAPLHFVSLSSRAVTLYINGEYWGIYYLQESPDERLVAQIDDVDADDVNVIGSWTGSEENGSNEGFKQMMGFIANADLSDSLQYRYLCSLVDIDDFIDYQLFEAFIANKDWPANNMRCFQHGASQWRWIFYDGDAAFPNPNYDMLTPLTYTGDDDWPSSTASTLFLRKLLESPLFLARFQNRMAELNGTVFSYSNTAPLLESALDEVEKDVKRQVDRFDSPSSVFTWRGATGRIDKFLRKRPEVFGSQMMEIVSVPVGTTVSFLLYPNPVHGECTICCISDMMGYVQYGIFDLMGRMVQSDALLLTGQNAYTLNLSPLPTGVYTLRFLPSGHVLRLVVE